MNRRFSMERRLWDRAELLLASPAAMRELAGDIRRRRERLEAARERSGTASPARDREIGWLRFLESDDAVTRHLTVLSRLRRLMDPSTAWVCLTAINGLYRVRPDGERLEVVCSEGFLDAPVSLWGDLVREWRHEGDLLTRGRIRAWAVSAPFQAVMKAILGDPDGEPARGTHVDLAAVFERVNGEWFAGALERPHLAWSARRTRRRFGYYQPGTDRLVLSRTLDDPAVPLFVVDFVMYHELLHKALGVRHVNGRQRAHTAAFRRAERRFPRFAEAQEWLRKLAR